MLHISVILKIRNKLNSPIIFINTGLYYCFLTRGVIVPLSGGRGRKYIYVKLSSSVSIFCPPPLLFTALHAMQTRSSDENSVRLTVYPSVRASVKHVDCDKTDERSVQILLPYERSFSLVSEMKNGWWGRPLRPEILGQAFQVGAKSPIFNRYSLVAPQP